MAEKTFIDVYGLRFHTNGSPVGKRKQHYAIIKRKDEILCQYNKADKLFCIPKSADIVQKRKPKKSFSVESFIFENGRFICEQQDFDIYSVRVFNDVYPNTFWCSINDILLGNIPFAATQKTGFKNFLVRVISYAKNL
ncbi:MAG: hypothetical protein IJ852_06495 [Alphaproteobacteria bacterium]|nr:hypothetical protein [Alphaproteobacteria bacterium]